MSSRINPMLHGVPETLLLPLYVRAMEAARPDAMLRDEKAACIMERLDYDFSKVRMQGHDELAVVMRAREFDRRARDFLSRHPEGVVVHIGCGLDTRFERVDNGMVEWYDLVLPAVIALRRKVVETAGPRCHMLAESVFEHEWLDLVTIHRPRPFLFLAEGVLPYFPEQQVKSLVLRLRDRIQGAELVFDGFSPFAVGMDNVQLALTRIDARMRWGLRNPHDLEAWAEGIRLLEAWYYFQTPEPRLGGAAWLWRILGKSTGIYHYRLGEDPVNSR